MKLVSDRLVHLLYVMAMHVAPKAGRTVDIATSCGIDQESIMCPFDDQWLGFAPLLHWCKGVPYVSLIKSEEVSGIVSGHCRRVSVHGDKIIMLATVECGASALSKLQFVSEEAGLSVAVR